MLKKIPEWLSISRKELDDFFSNFIWRGNILDMGCGYKRVSESIKKLGGKTITLDIEKKYRPDVIADAKHLPFKDNSIDTIISDGLLEHFDKSELGQIISEEIRVFNNKLINIIPKDTWWNRVLEYFQGTPKVFWKSKVQWQFIFSVNLMNELSNFLAGTTTLKRLHIFTIVPFKSIFPSNLMIYKKRRLSP